jgi:hypothetical protein
VPPCPAATTSSGLLGRVAALMRQLLDPSLGPVAVQEVFNIMIILHADGSPRAVALAGALGSLRISGASSAEVCTSLSRAVFDWQLSCM